MWPAPGYSSGNVERYIREQRVVQSSGNGYFSEQRTVESFHREQRPVYGSHSQALSIGPPMQGSNFQQFGPAPTDQRSRYDFNTVGNPGPVTPIGHSDQYSSNPLQHFDALTLGGPSDPYGSRSTPRGNYGSAGPSTYGNPGQLTYGQCNDQSGLNPFGNIRSNPGIFTPRGNSSYSCNNGHPGRSTYRECSGCGGSGNSGNPGRLTYGERSDRYDMKSSGQRDRKNRRHAMRKGSRKRDSSSDNNSDSNSGSGSGSDNDSDSENDNENDSDSESES